MLKNFNLNNKSFGIVDLRLKKAVSAENASNKKNYTVNNFAKKRTSSNRSPLLAFLIVLLFILAAAAVAGFFFFNQNFSGHSLRITLKGPKSATAGEEIKFELIYENLDKTSLTKMQMVAEYPEGFYFTGSNIDPANSEGSVWDLPELPSKNNGTIILSGQMFGEANISYDFNFIFRYSPANFSSDFKEEIGKTVAVKDTNYPFFLTAPEKINDGDFAEWKITLENKTKDDLPALYLQLEPGEGFIASESNPEANGFIWEIGTLAAKEKRDFYIKGEYGSEYGNTHRWRVTWRQEISEGGKKKIKYIIKKEGDLEVVKPEISVQLGLKDKNQHPAWGNNVDFKITYNNTGKIALENVLLTLKLNGLIDWPKVHLPENIRAENGALYWLPNEKNKFLLTINAGAIGEVVASLPLIAQPNETVSLSPEEMILRATAELSEKFNGKDKIFSSNEYVFPFSAESNIKTEARYYLDQNTKVGSGPVPPVIGQITKYRIYWKVYSGSVALKNVKIKTVLPSYINWRQQADASTFGSALTFNESSREVVWDIPELSGYAQGLASFDISVQPKEDQINQLLILTNPASFSAINQESGSAVAKIAGLLTSDLIGDPVVQGNGRVMVGK